MAEERDRIARDLHDLVIQRVFGAGMRLSAMLPAAQGPTADRLREVVAELDSVISDIRTTIFDLQTEAAVRGGLRAGVRQLAADAAERLGFQPRVRFSGPGRHRRRPGRRRAAAGRPARSPCPTSSATPQATVGRGRGGRRPRTRAAWWPTTASGAAPERGDGLRAAQHGLAGRRRSAGTFAVGPNAPRRHHRGVAGAAGRAPPPESDCRTVIATTRRRSSSWNRSS